MGTTMIVVLAAIVAAGVVFYVVLRLRWIRHEAAKAAEEAERQRVQERVRSEWTIRQRERLSRFADDPRPRQPVRKQVWSTGYVSAEDMPTTGVVSAIDWNPSTSTPHESGHSHDYSGFDGGHSGGGGGGADFGGGGNGSDNNS